MDLYFKLHEAVDLDVLSRITEAEVEAWLLAKLHRMRESNPDIHYLTVAANARPWVHGTTVDTTQWTVHNEQSCNFAPDLQSALAGLRAQA